MGCGGSTEKKEEAKPVEATKEQEDAATKIQAIQRGKKDRAKVEQMKSLKNMPTEPRTEAPSASSELYQKFFNRFQSLSEPQNKEARNAAWKDCDPNGSNKVSLAEFDGWIQKNLKEEYGEAGDEIWARFRPCYKGAHKDAADVAPGDDDFVTKREFRVAINYVILHANLFDAFSNIDGGSGVTGADDDQVTLEEFCKAAGALKASPFCAFTSESIDGKEEAVFKEINTSGEKILFRELLKYAEDKEVAAGTKIGKLMNLGEEDEK